MDFSTLASIRTNCKLKSSAFFYGIFTGREGKIKNCSEIWDIKFAASVARPPEWCEFGRLGLFGKLPLERGPGGGEFFL